MGQVQEEPTRGAHLAAALGVHKHTQPPAIVSSLTGVPRATVQRIPEASMELQSTAVPANGVSTSSPVAPPAGAAAFPPQQLRGTQAPASEMLSLREAEESEEGWPPNPPAGRSILDRWRQHPRWAKGLRLAELAVFWIVNGLPSKTFTPHLLWVSTCVVAVAVEFRSTLEVQRYSGVSQFRANVVGVPRTGRRRITFPARSAR